MAIGQSPGALIRYTLNYANNGNQAAANVAITETVPADTTFAGPDSTWSCNIGDPAGTTCIYTLDILVGDSSGSVDFQVRVDDPLSSKATQTINQVAIGDDGANGLDQNPNDNVDAEVTPIDSQVSIIAEKTDVQASDADNNGLVSPGDAIEYTIQIQEHGQCCG